jgi:hypothetical protein
MGGASGALSTGSTAAAGSGGAGRQGRHAARRAKADGDASVDPVAVGEEFPMQAEAARATMQANGSEWWLDIGPILLALELAGAACAVAP